METTTYRYSLGKRTGTCPACGRRTFKFYIDNTNGSILHDECGRCNRENNCAYHRPPREFIGVERSREQIPAPEKTSISFVDPALIERSRRDIEDDTLYKFFCSKFPIETVDAVFRAYHVGSVRWSRCYTVFWLVDRQNRVRSGKLMEYNTDGHRCKTGGDAQINYMHIMLRLFCFEYDQAFFGAHLVDLCPERTLLVVESEKTALMLACALSYFEDGKYAGQYLPIAVGGASMLHLWDKRMHDPDYKGNILVGRNVCLIPDADMYRDWERLSHDIARYAAVKVIHPRTFHLRGSEDIADQILWQLRLAPQL